jgi:hypothetical protein
LFAILVGGMTSSCWKRTRYSNRNQQEHSDITFWRELANSREEVIGELSRNISAIKQENARASEELYIEHLQEIDKLYSEHEKTLLQLQENYDEEIRSLKVLVGEKQLACNESAQNIRELRKQLKDSIPRQEATKSAASPDLDFTRISSYSDTDYIDNLHVAGVEYSMRDLVKFFSSIIDSARSLYNPNGIR